MSTDCSRSKGILVDFLKIAPVSMRSSSSSMTNRVKYQEMNPAMAASSTTTARTGRIQSRPPSSNWFSPALVTISRPQPIAIATNTSQPRTNGVSGCGRSVGLSGPAVGAGWPGAVRTSGSADEVRCGCEALITLKRVLRRVRSAGLAAVWPPPE